MKFPRLLHLGAMASLFAFSALNVAAGVRWIDRDHDFGLMKEIAGPKTGTSRFVNLGPDTISIFHVRPSCGCTSAEWSDAPIAPGDTAVVSYTYDPTMRPGKFDKSVKVQLSDGSRHSIRITGNVLGTPESLASLYPLEAGNLRLSEVMIDMGQVKKGHTPLAFVNAYCLTNDSVAPSVSSDIPGLRISPSVKKAGPGDLITYTLEFSSRKAPYGPLQGDILFADGDNPNATPLPWKTFIVPDPELRLRAQNGRNPFCEIRPDPVDFGVQPIVPGSVSTEVIISNTGKAPLDVYAIISPSPAISVSSSQFTVKPGKKTKLNITLDTSLISRGPARIPLTILTSDPARTIISLPVAIYGQ